MRSVQYLNLDINKKTQQVITANVGEIGSRYVKIKLIDNDKPLDLTGVSVFLYSVKSDDTKVFNTAEIEDAKNGIILAQITSQLMLTPGSIKLTLVLLSGDSKLGSKEFTLNVDDSILKDEVVESTNEFTALTTALTKVQGIDNKFANIDEQFISITNEKATKLGLEVERQRINSFTKLAQGSTTGDAELIDARIGSDSNVYENIGDSIRHQISGLTNAIQTGSKPFILTDWVKNLWGDSSETFVSSSEFHYFPSGETITINCERGYEYGYRTFNSNGDIIDTIWFLQGTNYIVVDGSLKYKFVIRKSDNSSVSLDIANKLNFSITSPIAQKKELKNTSIYNENYFNYKTIFDNCIINNVKNNLNKRFEDLINQNINNDYFQSDLIEVENGDEFTLWYSEGYKYGFTQINFFRVFFFNKNRILVSYYDFETTGLIQIINDKVKYMSFGCNKSYYKNIDSYIVVKGRNNPNRHIPYKKTLKVDDIPLALEDDVFTWKGKKVFTYGDSITQFGHWQSMVRDYFKFNLVMQGCSGALVVNNEGADGNKWWINQDGTTNTSIGASPTNPSNCTLVDAYFSNPVRINTIPTDVDCIIIMGGTNDMANNVPLGQVGFDDKTFKGSLCLTIKRMMEKCPNAVIIVMTLINGKSMTSNVNLDRYATNSLGLTTKDYANASIECAEYLAVPYINLHDTCMINPFNRSAYMRDNDHPTYGVENAGATRIARVVIGAMKNIEPNVYDSYLY